MKKSFIILASAVVILASCAKDDKLQMSNNPNEQGGYAIGFTSYTGIQTRAADNNKDASTKWDLENHSTSFDVWAWKFYDGQWVTTPVYGTELTGDARKGTVTYSVTEQTWTADPIKFWDKSADKYYFYAAAPSDAKWTLTGTGASGKLSYADFTLAGGIENNLSYNTTATITTLENSFLNVDDVDLMIAEDNVVLRAKYNKDAPEDVYEIFDHILSRLNVTVALKDGGALEQNNEVVKVTNFLITGVNLKNKGSFNEAADLGTDVLNEGTIKRWNTLSTVGTYNLPGASISDSILTDKPLYIAQYLIIPQAITSEVLDRAKATLPDTYYTQEEIDAATSGDDAYDKTINDIKTAGAAASHPYLMIAYTINGEPYTAYYNLANAFGKAPNSTLNFCEGWQNTLHIILDADVITFDPQVYEWTDKENQNVTIFD
jgi:hypothetical protein